MHAKNNTKTAGNLIYPILKLVLNVIAVMYNLDNISEILTTASFF